MISRRHHWPVLSAVFTALLVLAPPALARPDLGGPTAVAAKFPAGIDVSVPPGGSATVGSPPIPLTMGSLVMDVAPEKDDEAFNSLRLFLSEIPTPGKRILACAFIFRGIVHGLDDDSFQVKGSVDDAPLALLFMSMCAQLAVSIDNGPPKAAAAATGCSQQRRQVAISISRSGSRYSGSFDGTVQRSTKRPPLRITCKRKGTGYSIRVRPRKKGARLRSVTGSRVRLGFQSPASTSSPARMRVTFRK